MMLYIQRSNVFINVLFYFSGVSRTPSNAEVLYARQHLVTVAKAFNLSAIDMVNINIKGTFSP